MVGQVRVRTCAVMEATCIWCCMLDCHEHFALLLVRVKPCLTAQVVPFCFALPMVTFLTSWRDSCASCLLADSALPLVSLLNTQPLNLFEHEPQEGKHGIILIVLMGEPSVLGCWPQDPTDKPNPKTRTQS